MSVSVQVARPTAIVGPAPAAVSTAPQSFLAPDRLDLVVKYRWFRHLLRGDDPDAEVLYRWHIWCRTGGYEHDGTSKAEHKAVKDSRALLRSMRARGFDPAYPVRVGVNDRLLDGAHRVACALALRLPEIWQVEDPREARRTWGIDWFAAHGLDADEQRDLLLRFAKMRAWFA